MHIRFSSKGLFFTFYCIPVNIFHMIFLKYFIFYHSLEESSSKQTVSICREIHSQQIRVCSRKFHKKMQEEEYGYGTIPISASTEKNTMLISQFSRRYFPATPKVKSFVCKDHMPPHQVQAAAPFISQ